MFYNNRCTVCIIEKRKKREKKSLKAVSITVWVCLKAVVTEKSKEKNKPIKTNLNDNDPLRIVIAILTQFFQGRFSFALSGTSGDY